MKLFLVCCLILLTHGQFTFAEGAVTSKNDTVTSQTPIPLLTTTRKPVLPEFRLPCSCAEGQCGCCTGSVLAQFNQKACANFTYEPDDFALTAAMSLNGRVLYRRTVSGKNPAPLCVRLPRLQFIRFCVQFSNIYFASRNVHLCIDMEANWEDLTLVEWSFDCIRMGAAGVAVVGPEDGGGLPASPVDAVDQTDEDYDDSARGALRLTHSGALLLLDESLGSVDPRDVDRNLIEVRKLDNGDVAVAYGRRPT